MSFNINNTQHSQALNSGNNNNTTIPLSSSVLGRMANLWATLLDSKSNDLLSRANAISNNTGDKPGDLALLTAATHEMSYLTNSAISCNDTLGKALENLSRKS
jgi:hypothetical protein